jgi:amidase
VGVKPSHGLIPEAGVQPFAPSLDHVGFFVRSMEDAELAFSLLTGMPAQPRTMASRIAVVTTSRASAMSPDAAAALDRAARELCGSGAVVEMLDWPAELDAVWSATVDLAVAEAAEVFGTVADAGQTGPDIIEAVRSGRALPAGRHEETRSMQAELRERFHAFIHGFDAVLTVPTTGIAPKGLAGTGDPVFCIPWSFLGVPAVTLPVAWSEGLPLGLQFVGRFGEDAALLALARWCEPDIRTPLRFPDAGAF